jgi:murein L,D-transpeptidase YcbB/YkuD
MKNLLLSFGLSLTILGVNSLPILAQSTNSYTRCRNNPNEYCLRRGDQGALVRELIGNLMCVLNPSFSYPINDTEAVFTEEVERAVRDVQRSTGLTVDGIAGPRTRDVLTYSC